jgi:erythromycin esterase-like protein
MRMTAAAIIAVVLGTLSACMSESAEVDGVFLNNGFEYATPLGHPQAWYVEADAEAVEVMVDATRPRGGEHGLHIRTTSDDPVVLYTPLQIGDRCPAEISATASFFSESAGLSISLFYLEPGRPLQMGERSAAAAARWQRVTAALSAEPEGCLPKGLIVGLFLSGHGEIWIDDLEISTDDPDYRLTARPPVEPSSRDVELIEEFAIVVRTLDPEAEVDDLDPMRDLFEGARIVGLGENSHGARGLFLLKHRLIRYLIEEMGFTAFALEMPVQSAGTVNDYVAGRTDDREVVLAALRYPSWQTEEMWALIEWIREHNRSSESQVTFHGLDVEAPDPDGRSDDELMADEVTRILDAMPDTTGMVLWADNTHVTQAGDAMGAQLSERFGDAYVAVGLTYDEGFYSAYGPKLRYEVHPGYPGTHEYLLSMTGLDGFLLDLDQLPASHALNDTRGFRYIGSMPQELTQFYPHDLNEHFDVLGFIRRTESTRYLVEHEF